MRIFAQSGVVAIIAVATACNIATSTDAGGENTGASNNIVTDVKLIRFSGDNACGALQKSIQDSLINVMRGQYANCDGAAYKRYYSGLGFGAGATGGSTGAPTASAGDKNAPVDFTTTNNQVDGVDEADIIKNDATRIFALSGQTLYIAKSWPAADLAIVGKLNIEGWPQGIFLDGANTAVVISSLFTSYPLDATCTVGSARDCAYSYSNTVKVTVVDVSTPATPKVINEYRIPGYYNSARKIDSGIRIVTNDIGKFPKGLESIDYKLLGYYGYGGGDSFDAGAFASECNAVMERNAAKIREVPLSDWLPPATIGIDGGTMTTVPQACDRVSSVNAPVHFGTFSVNSIDLANPQTLGRDTMLSYAGAIYASAKRLYVTTPHYWWFPGSLGAPTTYVHAFDLSARSGAPYLASGVVPGTLVDQFSLDEGPLGELRMATTELTYDAGTSSNPWFSIDRRSRVSVLQQDGGVLETVGVVKDLAPGETLQASRFLGKIGFVVTFRQVDPLFTFDLSDPRNPTKKGELKIPGFSTYLHQLDATHLIGIGVYGENAVDGGFVPRPGGVGLSIFDVSDLAQPKQSASILIGQSRSGYSSAQWDHLAFNYFRARGVLAVPFSDWESTYTATDTRSYWSSFVSDLRVFSVDADAGFTARGQLSQADLVKQQTYGAWNGNWTYYWTPYVNRSVMADDYVYAISDAAIRVANIADLSRPVATALFDPATP